MARDLLFSLEVPEKLEPLLQSARYKGAYGGRGGAKSHFFAEQLIVRMFVSCTRAVCIREVQNTIKESVRQLLIDKIAKLGLGGYFEVLESEIRGPHGSLCIFRGMQSYNSESIKSLEGYDIAWVEEAQSLSAISLRMLRPTIRKPNSEIWFSWNPRHDTDPVDAFMRGPNRPRDAICVEVNWRDNPWFPEVLKAEKDRDYEADPDMADHVWGGGYQIVSEGSYYAKLIAQAEREGRIGLFPYHTGQVVKTSWDIGVDDFTAVWFIVDDGTRATVVDYYEASGDGADGVIAACMPEVFIPPLMDDQYINWRADDALAALGRDVPFRYAQHFLPHDIRMREWGAGARSRVETVQALGLRNIRKGVPINPAERIAAARRLLPAVRFNDTPRVQQGLKRLRQYRRKFNTTLQSFTTPEHDDNSHGADAFGEYAVNCPIRLPAPVPVREKKNLSFEVSDGTIVGNMSVEEIVRMKQRLARMGDAA